MVSSSNCLDSQLVIIRVILLYIVSLVTFLQHCVIRYLALFRAILYVNDSYWTEALYSLNHLLSCLLEVLTSKPVTIYR